MRTRLVGVVLCAAGAMGDTTPAIAQSATIEVVHDDPDGVVLPGQTVRISVLASFTGGGMLGGLSGDTVNSGAQGIASGISSWYPSGGLVNLGVPVGGSVYDTQIAVVPGYFGPCGFLLPYCSWNSGVHVLEFDWQAGPVEAPTLASFNFLASPTLPGLVVFPTPFLTPNWVVLPTDFSGTSLLVVPGPGAPCMLLVGMALIGRRRRDGCRRTTGR